MKIICVVKFVQDVDNFEYDHESHQLIRQTKRRIINPDDACAIGFALNYKKANPGTFVEVVTMGPKSVVPLVEDILRVGVDKAAIISDKLYAGSDTYATSMILGKYLSSCQYDCILTGSHAIDGDTAHIPPQIAALLQLNQLSNIIKIEEIKNDTKSVTVAVEDEFSISRYMVELPAVLGLTRESGYRLPYVRYENLNIDVKDKLEIITNNDLNIDKNLVGEKGSLTKVVQTRTKILENRKRLVVGTDDNGIETVYNFLKEKGFI